MCPAFTRPSREIERCRNNTGGRISQMCRKRDFGQKLKEDSSKYETMEGERRNVFFFVLLLPLRVASANQLPPTYV